MGLEGKTLQGRYLIERQVGQGGMGAVYIASDQRFNATVAIKQTLCMDDNYRMAIEREARLLNSLKHNALPRVIDHFVENNGQFLVMEYIPGEDLHFILEETSSPFPVDKVLSWADELLDALDFLHNQEVPVIHRDIKPQNLKLQRNGNVVLLDFGLAKGTPTESNNKTAAKSIFGYSRNYASLEQIQGTGTDPRSDLYSLAATLYHLAVGSPPEDALTRAMAVLNETPDPLVPAHMANPAVPAGVSAILYSAMSLNAANRPESADEMRAMLAEHESYADHAPVMSVAAAATGVRPQIYAQKTRLLPEATSADIHVSTEARTRLMPEDGSVMTKVREPKTTVSEGGYRQFAFAAGGLGVLLAAGVFAGAFFVFEPYSDLPVERQMQLVPSSQGQVELDQPASPNDGAANPTEIASNVETTFEPNARAATTSPPPKQAERTPGATSPRPPKQPETLAPDEMVVVGETVYMGNMKITTSGIEPFDGKLPKLAPGVEGPKRITLNELTPEQQRRLKAIRQNNFNFNVKVPRPPHRPGN
ncbi:MAG TPA: protein kinase [Pyrinomonadaceae bacterium]|nr:protein kinase [Pyrinomonadaceae bacterium]